MKQKNNKQQEDDLEEAKALIAAKEPGQRAIAEMWVSEIEKMKDITMPEMRSYVSNAFRINFDRAGLLTDDELKQIKEQIIKGYETLRQITAKLEAPEGINFKVTENRITVSGFDKQLVGEVASRIRKVRPAEPYKGKGIKYEGETIRRKAGKAGKAAT